MKSVLVPSGALRIANLGPGDLSIGAVSAISLADAPAAQEIDPHIGYSLGLGPVALDPGYMLHLLPDADQIDAMHELSAKVTSASDAPIQLFLGVGVDPFRAESWYAFGGAKHTFTAGAFSLATTLNIGASDAPAVVGVARWGPTPRAASMMSRPSTTAAACRPARTPAVEGV